MSLLSKDKENKVIFTGCSEIQHRWGNHTGDYRSLTIGATYMVERKEVHSQHTKMFLVGIDGSFNSVCFEEVGQDPQLFQDADRILRACLGTLGEDEELPPWVRWDKVDQRNNFAVMDGNSSVMFSPEEPKIDHMGYPMWCFDGPFYELITFDEIIYLPHPSLWHRSLQRKPT